jgi:hypothetical protein
MMVRIRSRSSWCVSFAALRAQGTPGETISLAGFPGVAGFRGWPHGAQPEDFVRWRSDFRRLSFKSPETGVLRFQRPILGGWRATKRLQPLFGLSLSADVSMSCLQRSGVKIMRGAESWAAEPWAMGTLARPGRRPRSRCQPNTSPSESRWGFEPVLRRSRPPEIGG